MWEKENRKAECECKRRKPEAVGGNYRDITFWDWLTGIEVIWGGMEKGGGATGCLGVLFRWGVLRRGGLLSAPLTLPCSDSSPVQDLSGSAKTMGLGRNIKATATVYKTRNSRNTEQ